MKRKLPWVVLVVLAGAGAGLYFTRLSWLPRLARLLPVACADGRQNALWMGHRWSGKAPGYKPPARPPQPPPSSEEVRSVGAELARRGFRDLYIHAGPLDAKGAIPARDPATWQRIRDELRTSMPGVRLFAYVGGLTQVSFGKAPDTIDHADAAVRAAVVKTCTDLVHEAGFDGLHYDIEMVPSGDPYFLQLLDETRPALQGKPLSISASIWHHTYMAQMAHRCDQVALMSYDMRAAAPTPEAYQMTMQQIVPAMCRIFAGSQCRFLMGIAASDEVTGSHDPLVENVENGLWGVRRGLLATSDSSAFQGVALYPHWHMDETDWQQYDSTWLR